MKTDHPLKPLDYPVPAHSMRVGYMLGGIALCVFAILFISGAALAWFGYTPTEQLAHRSLETINASATLSGARSAHAVAAEVFLALIILHALRIAFTRSHAGPRRNTWYVGVLLLGVTTLFYFSGTVLKWDQEGYEAFSHLEWLTGGAAPALFGDNVPMRMFVIHAVVAPAALLSLLALHLLLVKLLGISPLAPGNEGEGESVGFLKHMRHVAAYGLIVIGLIKLSAAFYTPPLLGAPVMDVEWTKPPWPFLFLYPLESYGGMWTLVAAPIVAGAALLAVPSLVRPDKRRDLSQLLFAGLFLLWAALTLLGAWVPPAHHMM